MAPIRIALGQFAATPDPARNLRVCTDLFHRAVSAGAKLLFLPEASDYITPTPAPHLARSDFLISLASLSKEKSIPILVGAHTPSPDPERPYNSLVYITPERGITETYHKLHLFDVTLPTITLRESASTTPGDALVPPIDTPAGKVGLQICFDLRFPAPSAALRNMGANALVYPSAFTVPTGAAHWEVLLRARAVENQCWVIAAAQCGWHFKEGEGERCSYGDSMIVDPWGRIVARGGKVDVGEGRREVEEELVVCEIDVEECDGVRERLPLRGRDDVYGAPTVKTV